MNKVQIKGQIYEVISANYARTLGAIYHSNAIHQFLLAIKHDKLRKAP